MRFLSVSCLSPITTHETRPILQRVRINGAEMPHPLERLLWLLVGSSVGQANHGREAAPTVRVLVPPSQPA